MFLNIVNSFVRKKVYLLYILTYFLPLTSMVKFSFLFLLPEGSDNNVARLSAL